MEVTLSELAEEFGISMSHLVHLIKRGILPIGRREGKFRYMPAVECKIILGAHKNGGHWVQGRSRPGKQKAATKKLTWKDLL